MQTELIKGAEHSPNLILYFAGWGTPASAVSHLVLPEKTDLLLCYDYQDLNFHFDLSHYAQIRVVAWSMGVWVANQVLGQMPLVSATAINGTGKPCDDTMGIPQAVFIGTLEQLDERHLVKFQRRMCGDSATFEQYCQLEGQRDWQQVRSELGELYQYIQQDKGNAIDWTRAIIGEKDRIFPSPNQRAYWQTYMSEKTGNTAQLSAVQNSTEFVLQTMPLPHYPFAQFHTWAELF
ncbi:DUF452 family protein [Avibacterium sp. 21-595]|uniref:DUF452 family protein n=1 Tax=Avibacterium sp. 21-595 TaxID=2911527 RepID=UPI002026EFD6|nr:pimeloyl-ACP methyl esterase BioG family protein [Avibacterium sp. 21-595]URL07034.1 DUF452 family protein [Avibacterium sp. 21-595]